MKKQTAVEWLHQKLATSSSEELVGNINIWFTEAKAMEKEEQRLIYEGLLQNIGTSVKQSDLPTFEQYYTETYGK
jgi:hypothetical protein